jgi:hypothetical protein
VAPSKKNEKNLSLSSTMLINWFEGSYGTYGKEQKNPLSSTTLGQFAQKIKIIFI